MKDALQTIYSLCILCENEPLSQQHYFCSKGSVSWCRHQRDQVEKINSCKGFIVSLMRLQNSKSSLPGQRIQGLLSNDLKIFHLCSGCYGNVQKAFFLGYRPKTIFAKSCQLISKTMVFSMSRNRNIFSHFALHWQNAVSGSFLLRCYRNY